MEVDLKRLHQVLAIVKAGSFSQAAEELHITQPALSRSIAALENHYGIRIFERGRGGASLTTTGKALVNEAEILLRKARSADHNLQLLGIGESGAIAFGMGPLIASMILPSLSQHFLHNRARLNLKAVAKSANVLYQELMDDNIEILFCGTGQLADHSNIVIAEMGKISLSIMVRSTHPLANQKAISLDEIFSYPILSGAEMLMLKREDRSGSFICDNYHILRETALGSDGVWITSPQLVIDDIRDGRLTTLRLTDDVLQPSVNIGMVYRENNLLSPGALAIKDFVQQHLALQDSNYAQSST